MAERRQFVQDYETYYYQCIELSSDEYIPMIMPLGACIAQEVRAEILEFELEKTLEDTTELDWKRYFRASMTTTQGNYKLLEQSVNKLRLDWTQADATSMVNKLRSQILKALRDQGMIELTKSDPKRLIAFIVPALQPAALQQLVRDEMADVGWRSVQQKSMVRFFSWLEELVRGYLRYRTVIESDKKPSNPPTKNDKPRDGVGTSRRKKPSRRRTSRTASRIEFDTPA